MLQWAVARQSAHFTLFYLLCLSSFCGVNLWFLSLFSAAAGVMGDAGAVGVHLFICGVII